MKVYFIVLIVFFGLAIFVNLLAFVLEKVYKKRMLNKFDKSKEEK